MNHWTTDNNLTMDNCFILNTILFLFLILIYLLNIQYEQTILNILYTLYVYLVLRINYIT